MAEHQNTERLAQVGEVIAHGPIPGNVLEFDDGTSGHSVWERADGEDRWNCVGTTLKAQDGGWVVQVYAPLIVTRVREATAPAACPAHGEHPHDERVCLDCPICRPPASEPQHADAPVDPRYLAILDLHADHEHNERGSVATALAEILAVHAEDVRAEVRQQADASTLLDLVRQYGAACATMPLFQHGGSARALLARIAELVPPYEQARDYYGVPLWIHGCGHVARSRGETRTVRCDCLNPEGPWRPLLVGRADTATTVPIDGDRIIALARQQQAQLDEATQKLAR